MECSKDLGDDGGVNLNRPKKRIKTSDENVDDVDTEEQHSSATNCLPEETDNNNNNSSKPHGPSESLMIMGQELICPCCFEILVQATTLVPCGHTFCNSCVFHASDDDSYLIRSCWIMRCPTCRETITDSAPNRVVNNFIEQAVSMNPDNSCTASLSIRLFPASDIQTYQERIVAASPATSLKEYQTSGRTRFRERRRNYHHSSQQPRFDSLTPYEDVSDDDSNYTRRAEFERRRNLRRELRHQQLADRHRLRSSTRAAYSRRDSPFPEPITEPTASDELDTFSEIDFFQLIDTLPDMEPFQEINFFPETDTFLEIDTIQQTENEQQHQEAPNVGEATRRAPVPQPLRARRSEASNNSDQQVQQAEIEQQQQTSRSGAIVPGWRRWGQSHGAADRQPYPARRTESNTNSDEQEVTVQQAENEQQQRTDSSGSIAPGWRMWGQSHEAAVSQLRPARRSESNTNSDEQEGTVQQAENEQQQRTERSEVIVLGRRLLGQSFEAAERRPQPTRRSETNINSNEQEGNVQQAENDQQQRSDRSRAIIQDRRIYFNVGGHIREVSAPRHSHERLYVVRRGSRRHRSPPRNNTTSPPEDSATGNTTSALTHNDAVMQSATFDTITVGRQATPQHALRTETFLGQSSGSDTI